MFYDLIFEPSARLSPPFIALEAWGVDEPCNTSCTREDRCQNEIPRRFIAPLGSNLEMFFMWNLQHLVATSAPAVNETSSTISAVRPKGVAEHPAHWALNAEPNTPQKQATIDPAETPPGCNLRKVGDLIGVKVRSWQKWIVVVEHIHHHSTHATAPSSDRAAHERRREQGVVVMRARGGFSARNGRRSYSCRCFAPRIDRL